MSERSLFQIIQTKTISSFLSPSPQNTSPAQWEYSPRTNCQDPTSFHMGSWKGKGSTCIQPQSQIKKASSHGMTKTQPSNRSELNNHQQAEIDSTKHHEMSKANSLSLSIHTTVMKSQNTGYRTRKHAKATQRTLKLTRNKKTQKFHKVKGTGRNSLAGQELSCEPSENQMEPTITHRRTLSSPAPSLSLSLQTPP